MSTVGLNKQTIKKYIQKQEPEDTRKYKRIWRPFQGLLEWQSQLANQKALKWEQPVFDPIDSNQKPPVLRVDIY